MAHTMVGQEGGGRNIVGTHGQSEKGHMIHVVCIALPTTLVTHEHLAVIKTPLYRLC